MVDNQSAPAHPTRLHAVLAGAVRLIRIWSMQATCTIGNTVLPNDLDEFLAADDAVVVDVVEGEGPLQLVLRRPLRDHREELHEVPEGDPTGPVPDKGGG